MFDYIQGEIVDIISVSNRVKLFYWRPEKDLAYAFIPGQFTIVSFPEIEGNMPHRSYSIAGIQDKCVELCISFKEGGAATNILWNKKVGDLLELTEAKGEFVLKESPTKEVCFIATGTGIAPFKPMIAELLEMSNCPEIYLVYGNRTQADIIYHNLWEQLNKEYANFHYLPVLSQEDQAVRKGYVHPYYMDLFADGRDAQFYLCGWDEMLKESRRNLKTLGYNRKQYFIESYN